MAKSTFDLSSGPRAYFDRRTGGLKIISLSAGASHDVLVDGKFVGVAGGTAKTGRTERVNRLVDSELASQELPWLDSATDVPVKKNLSPDWTLEGSNTAFIKSAAAADEKPVTAVFNCPVEGEEISVTAGRTYCFQALFGLHRAEGSVNLVFLDQEGEVLKTFKAPISTNHQGGRTIAQYYRVDLSAQAPAGAAKLRIEIVKGLTLKGADSFLFFAHPALVQAAAMADYKWIERDLPDAAVVDLFGLADAAFVVRDVAIPGEALDGGFHNVTVRDCETGATSPSVPVELPDSMRCTGQVYGIEGSSVTAHIGLPPSWTNRVTLSLWIDGQPDSRTFLSEAGSGTVRLPLASENCDGRPHVFEIRLGKSGQLIGAHAAIGPVSTTPWDALQRYAGMPLPSHISPIAAYRYASLASPHPASKEADAPEFHELHDILVEGFSRPRKSYRKLPFKRHASPVVSIVIPVHNKFDVTYVCLAGLLFARTCASFEVIVVDDGSSDTTCKIEDIAPGVVYVRNEVAQGFVGACNAGAAVARGRYIVFLNNDTEPTADWLDELLFVFANFDGVGLAGSKLIYADGYLQEAGGIVWETGDPWNYGRRGNASDPRFSYTRICDYLSGAAVMIPADLWQELGGFSQEFAPAYFEDTDLAFKVRNAGRKVVFAPRSVVVHYEGLSNGTDSAASSGLKRFQEINRPKFKRKWATLFSGNGKVGVNVDLAKDRGVAKRVVFFDSEFPRLDQDAGSYAAIQEIRMFQALGCKITFVPLNMAYLARHTDYLQRLGVETIYLPYYSDVTSFLKARGTEFDVAYITRYGVAEQAIGPLRHFAPQARIVVNIADLHFLRAIRDAMAEPSEARFDAAVKVRDAELAALGQAELLLTYSTVEQAILTSHLPRGPKSAIVPWVIESQPPKLPFAKRRDIAFIGGYRHTPNVAAVKFFADSVMPLLRAALPGVRFLVYGSHVPPEIEALERDDVVIKGFVQEVDEVFDNCRIFVAPLLSGAGMKGKVLDCIAAGVPSVLSPIAAEGIGLRDGFDAIIANRPEEWVAAITRIYNDEAAWNAMAENIQHLARERYSFAAGVAAMQESLGTIDVFLSADRPALFANSTRPQTGSVSSRHDTVQVPAEKPEPRRKAAK